MQHDLNRERSYSSTVAADPWNHALSAATQEMRVPVRKREGQSKGVKSPLSHVLASMGLRLLGSILKARSVQAERADVSTALPRHVVSLVINQM